MNSTIVQKQALASDVKRLDIRAPQIARKILPGQYVMVQPTSRSEAIPLSIVETDVARDLISVVFQEVGKITRQLGDLRIDDEICHILGPLGQPAEIKKLGTVVCVTSGLGATQILPICRAYQKMGNKVIGITGAKTRRLVMLEPQLRLTCHKVFIATNDGSYMRRGLATDILRDFLQQEKVDGVYAVGSVDLMHSACLMTGPLQIPTRVSLTPMILDATGMCGACRVKVSGQTIFACVDGPEFDGHRVDFEDLKIRMNATQVKRDEYGEEIECFSPKSIRKKPAEEPAILTKFLLGIQKNKR